MSDRDKTKQQLLEELAELRRRLESAVPVRKGPEAPELRTVSAPPAFEGAFLKAQDYVRHYFRDRIEDPEHSLILISGERYILVRAASMSVEFFDLVASLYRERGADEAHAVASNLLFDVAHNLGKSDARIFHSRMNLRDPVDRLAAGPVHFAHTGWAFVSILPGSRPATDDGFYLIYEHPFSFESDAWIARRRNPGRPICIMNAGYSSGWCSESFGFPLVAAEITCRAKGDPQCRFIMAPPGRIEAHIDEYLRERQGTKGMPVGGGARGGVPIPEYFLRKRLEDALVASRNRLEIAVLDRTAELDRTNRALTGKVEELERVQAALRSSEARLHLALAAARTASWELDIATGTMSYSDELGPFFGLATGGRHPDYEAFLKAVHPDDREAMRWSAAEALERDAPIARDFRALWPDGSVRWLSWRGRLIRDEAGRPLRLVGVTTDIHDVKAAEESRRKLQARMQHAQKLESLGVLAGGIAHDFNNLLVGVLSRAELGLLEATEGSPLRGHLEAIRGAAVRAAELTGQMLAYAGRGRFVVRPVDLNRLVREMLDLLRASASGRIEMRLDLASDLPLACGDASQLQQVLLNLATNAAEAIGPREGVVWLRTRAADLDAAALARTYLGNVDADLRPGRFVVLEVEDTGGGLDAEARSLVFDPFYTTKFTGRGLGLAAVLGIVRGHGGSIDIESRPGRGTTFRVYLPAAEDGAFPAAEVAEASVVPWRGSGRVLVVDDEEGVRSVAALILETIGFEAVAVESGARGVESVAADPAAFRAVLLDMTMPGMDGAATLDALRRIRADLPVVLMSGFSATECRERLEGRSLAGFLQKPFRIAELAEAMRLALERAP